MKYYAYYENNKLVSIGTDNGLGQEITEAEYNSLLAMIHQKREYIIKLYNDEITEEDVPLDYREEVIAEVEIMRENDREHQEEEASETEIGSALGELL